jgi:hypothetical protein
VFCKLAIGGFGFGMPFGKLAIGGTLFEALDFFASDVNATIDIQSPEPASLSITPDCNGRKTSALAEVRYVLKRRN